MRPSVAGVAVAAACVLLIALPATAAAPRIKEFRVKTSSSRPITIARGPDGALWFAEFSGNRIGRITTKGKVREFRVPTADSSPGQVAAGPDGAICHRRGDFSWRNGRCNA